MPHSAEPGLLESYKLATKFYKNHVSHTTFPNDTSGHGGPRKRPKQEIKWDNDCEIGKGSFGHVRLQKRRAPTNNGETVRAVKVIDKRAMRRHKIDYTRELEAMAALDRSQVSLNSYIIFDRETNRTSRDVSVIYLDIHMASRFIFFLDYVRL